MGQAIQYRNSYDRNLDGQLPNCWIKEVIEDLKKHDFGLYIEEDLNECLSCYIKIYEEDGIAWIQQPRLINKLKAKFGEEAMAMQGHGLQERFDSRLCA
jgi:hypothetical protein